MRFQKIYFLFIGVFVFSCSVVAYAEIGGIWEGESICTIKDSPCHDEHVIYHLTEPDTAGKVTIRADKVVNGQPEDMGTIDCIFDAKASKLNCDTKHGFWAFAVNGSKMTGTLKLPDGRFYRNVSLTKKP